MVRRASGAALALALLLALPSAALRCEAALEALPPRPEPPAEQPSAAWEDATAVTLVSLPFTAFWALIGALVVGGISQQHFPPDIDTPMLAGAAAVAGGASLGIGLVSLQWGGSRPTPVPSPSPLPAPTAEPSSSPQP